MKKMNMILTAGLVLLALLFSCKPAEPPINITYEMFVSEVDGKLWAESPDFNLMTEAEKAKFTADMAAAGAWKEKTGEACFTVTTDAHEGFTIIQEKGGKWYSLYRGVKTPLTEGSDPFAVPMLFDDFKAVYTELTWGKDPNFNDMTDEELRQFYADAAAEDNGAWKKPETAQEDFTIITADGATEVHQRKDGTWYRVTDQTVRELTEGDRLDLRVISYAEFLKTVAEFKWNESVNFNQMSGSEKESFRNNAEADGKWTITIPETAEDSFTAIEKANPEYIIKQNPEGEWTCTVEDDPTYGTVVRKLWRSVKEHTFDVKDVYYGNMFDVYYKDYPEDSEYEDYVNITGWKGPDENTRVPEGGLRELYVPEYIDGAWVYNIKEYAMDDQTWIETLTLPPRLDAVDGFKGCTGLKTINWPQNKDNDRTLLVCDNAFSGCTSLGSLDFTGCRAHIQYCAFADCTGLKTVDWGDQKIIFGGDMFKRCTGIKELRIPASVELSGQIQIFEGWTSDQKVIFEKDVTFEADYNLAAYLNNDATIVWEGAPDIGGFKIGTWKVDEYTTKVGISGYEGEGGKVTLKPLEWYGVQLNELKTTAIRDNRTITELRIESGMNIPGYAFEGWTDAQKIVIANGTDLTKWNAYWNKTCSAKIEYEFDAEGLFLLPIENSENFKLARMKGHDGTELTIPSVTADGRKIVEIGKRAFSGADFPNVTKLTISEGITHIGSGAFLNFGVAPDSASYGKLKEISLPETLESIGYEAFEYAASPEGCTVRVPISVTSVSQDAFDSWTKESTVTFAKGFDPEILKSAEITTSGAKIVIEQEGTDPKMTFIREGEGYTLTGYESGTESNCSLVIPADIDGIPVTRIKVGAFRDALDLVSLTIPSSVTVIDRGPFPGCQNLTEIIMSEDVPGNFYAKDGCLLIKSGDTAYIRWLCPGATVPAEYKTYLTYEAYEGIKYDDLYFPAKSRVYVDHALLDCMAPGCELRTAPGCEVVYRDDEFDEGFYPRRADIRILENWVEGMNYGWRREGYYSYITAIRPDQAKVTISNAPKDLILNSRIFSGRTDIKKLTLPETLKTIKDGTFNGWQSDQSITFISKPGGTENFKDKIPAGVAVTWNHIPGSDWRGYLESEGGTVNVLTKYLGPAVPFMDIKLEKMPGATKDPQYYILGKEAFKDSAKIDTLIVDTNCQGLTKGTFTGANIDQVWICSNFAGLQRVHEFFEGYTGKILVEGTLVYIQPENGLNWVQNQERPTAPAAP